MRFIGFTVRADTVSAFYISGTGNEVAYNEVVGQYMPTVDNHDGIRIDNADSVWIHHNNVHGVTGDGGNSTGIKIYYSTNLLITDNYVWGNITGIHDKGAMPGPNYNTYAPTGLLIIAVINSRETIR